MINQSINHPSEIDAEGSVHDQQAIEGQAIPRLMPKFQELLEGIGAVPRVVSEEIVEYKQGEFTIRCHSDNFVEITSTANLTGIDISCQYIARHLDTPSSRWPELVRRVAQLKGEVAVRSQHLDILRCVPVTDELDHMDEEATFIVAPHQVSVQYRDRIWSFLGQDELRQWMDDYGVVVPHQEGGDQ